MNQVSYTPIPNPEREPEPGDIFRDPEDGELFILCRRAIPAEHFAASISRGVLWIAPKIDVADAVAGLDPLPPGQTITITTR